jgi:hypothetical protein
VKHRHSHFAVGYWNRIRQGRVAPDQADLDPKALKRLLSRLFLLDTAGTHSGAAVYRLAGTTLCERFGGELRGKNFFTQWDVNSRAALAVLLRHSLRLSTPICLAAIGASEDCRMLEMETILMPIVAGGGEPARFLGLTEFLAAPSSLATDTIAFQRLVAFSFVQENGPEEDAHPPDAETAVEPGRAPHLRLIVSRGQVTETPRFDGNEALGRMFALCGVSQALNTRP